MLNEKTFNDREIISNDDNIGVNMGGVNIGIYIYMYIYIHVRIGI
jgi:hypothetical protein